MARTATAPFRAQAQARQSQSPELRVTRNTRSQSREIEDAKLPASPRKSQRNAQTQNKPQAQASSGSSTVKKDAAKGRKPESSKAQELPTIAEDNATDQDESQSTNRSEVDATTILETLPDLVSSAHKLVSSVLPANGAPEEQFTALEGLLEAKSKSARNYRRLKGIFDLQRGVFGGSAKLIDRQKVRTALDESGTSGLDLVIYLANVVSLLRGSIEAERSTQLEDLWLELDENFPNPFMSGFHSSGDLDANDGSSDLKYETSLLALTIRTERAVCALLKEDQDEPHFYDVLLDHFFDPQTPEQSKWSFDKAYKICEVKSWRLDSLDGGQLELTEESQNMVRARVWDISLCIIEEKGGTYFDVELLNEKFPWIHTLQEMTEWAQKRSAEIKSQLEAQGGVESVVESLEKRLEWGSDVEALREVEDKRGDEPSEPKRRATENAEMLKLFGTRQGALRLRELEEAHRRKSAADATTAEKEPDTQPAKNQAPSNTAPAQASKTSQRASKAPPTATAPVSEETGPDNWQPVPDELDPDNPSETISREEIFRRYLAVQKDKNKENEGVRRTPPPGSDSPASPQKRKRFFNEAQEHRERVAPISDDEEDEAYTNDRQPKRSRNQQSPELLPTQSGGVDDDSEVSEDRGFESDTRAVNPLRRRAVVQPPPAAAAAAAPGRVTASPSHARALTELSRPPSSSYRPDQPSLSPAPSPPHPTATARSAVPQFEYSRINDAAKRNSATLFPRKTQVRRAWTSEASQRLIELIEDDSIRTSWSKMEALGDPLLEGRDQVKLKDRARNMKLDFLKARIPLPHNFELVALKTADKLKLQEMGIEYE